LVSSLEPRGDDNPLRVLARIFGWASAVLNDPEVQQAGDTLFVAMERASKRYDLELKPATIPALEGGQDDDR